MTEVGRYASKAFLLLVAIGAMQFAAGAQAQTLHARVTNRLGITSEIDISQMEYGESLGEDLVKKIGEPSHYFLLEVGKGALIAIPFPLFKEAHLENNLHAVTLKTGMTYKGKLLGNLVEDAGRSAQPVSKLSLQSTTSIVLDSEQSPDAISAGRKRGETWAMVSPEPNLNTVLLENPRFGYRLRTIYQQRVNLSTYERRTSIDLKEDPAFVIQVGAEQIPACITDFSKLTFKGTPPELTLTSPSGIKTSGQLILGSRESLASEWALVADIANQNGALMILSAPAFTIWKVASAGQ